MERWREEGRDKETQSEGERERGREKERERETLREGRIAWSWGLLLSMGKTISPQSLVSSMRNIVFAHIHTLLVHLTFYLTGIPSKLGFKKGPPSL